MTKEEFQNKIADIKKRKDDILSQERILKASYLKSNSEFEIGEKVVIYNPASIRERRYAFIKSYSLNVNNEIMYDLWKCKKDGTPAKIQDYCPQSHINKLTL